MSRIVKVSRPSFPEDAPVDELFDVAAGERWQVLCGDAGHYRVGIYAPELTSPEEIAELEAHDCPELFCLLGGRVTLVLADGRGGTRRLPLQPGRPVLVRAPHAGYCPDGPHTGRALVVERDELTTEYRAPEDWT